MAQALSTSGMSIEDLLYANETKEKIKHLLPHSLQNSYLSTHVAYAFLSMGIFVAVKLLHQRKMLTLISPDATFKLKRFSLGFGVWFAIASVQTLIEFLYNQATFSWNFQPIVWLTFLPWALVCTPIQTTAEELLFRGYFLQGLGCLTRQPIMLAIASSLPFAIAHFGNPEMSRGAAWIALSYLLMGIFLVLITLKDERLELALGVHAANNLFVVLVVNTQDSVLPTPALIMQQTPTDPRFTILALLSEIAIFYGLLFWPRRYPT